MTMIQLWKKCKQGVLGQHCWHMLLIMMLVYADGNDFYADGDDDPIV